MASDEPVGQIPPKPDYWPEDAPYDPVEVYFTPEEEAALDEVWEEIGRETAARQAAEAEAKKQKK